MSTFTNTDILNDFLTKEDTIFQPADLNDDLSELKLLSNLVKAVTVEDDKKVWQAGVNEIQTSYAQAIRELKASPELLRKFGGKANFSAAKNFIDMKRVFARDIQAKSLMAGPVDEYVKLISGKKVEYGQALAANPIV